MENHPPEDLAQNPYPGLNSYDEDRQEYFMGRDREKQEVLQTLDLHSLCFLIGKSGLGKSSLINAGIVPELKRTGHAPIQIRINFDNDANLTAQVKHTIEEKIKAIDHTAIAFDDLLLWEYFQQVKLFNGYLKPVLIFDQFEEIFTRGQNKQAELNSLMAEIIDLAENRVPEKVQQRYADEGKTVPSNLKRDYEILFALREDYLPQLTSLKNYLPTLKFSIYRLAQMSGPDAFKAVFFPAQKASPPLLNQETAWEIVSKLPESFDDELNITNDEKPKDNDQFASKRIEPFLLNLFCFTLNEERKDKGLPTITKNDVTNKDFGKLVKDYYNKVTGRSWRLSEAIENELVTPNGKYRKFASEDDFVKGAKRLNIAWKLTDSDVQYLINKKIIRRKRISDINYYELIHDTLIPVVVQKRKLRTSITNIIYWTMSVLVLGAIFLYMSSVAQARKQADFDKRQQQAEIEKQQQLIKFNRLKQQADLDKQQQQSKYNQLQQQLATDQKIAKLTIAQQQTQLDLVNEQEKTKKAQLAGIATRDSIKSRDSIMLDASTRAQKQQLKDTLTYFKELYASQNASDPAQKLSHAMTAYNSLSQSQRDKDIFDPAVYSALINSQIATLRNSKFHPSLINGVLESNKRKYFVRPYYGVTDIKGTPLIKSDTNLIHSWINQSGKTLATVLRNQDKSKEFVFTDLISKAPVDSVYLPPDQDITSVVFDPDPNSKICIYSTRFPARVYKLTVQARGTPAQIWPANQSSLQKNEKGYMFLANGEDQNFIGITSKGEYVSGNYKEGIKHFNAIINNETISAIAYSAVKGVFAGCESGKIYQVDPSNKVTLFAGHNASRISSLACSPNGNWLAAGCFNGNISLWDFTPAGLQPSDLSIGYAEPITTLSFSTYENKLFATTNSAYIFGFPLSMKAVVNIKPESK